MTIAQTRARRRQMVGKYRHIAKIGRPMYLTMTPERAAKQRERLLTRQRAMQGRKGK